jgi:hypothetical protein
MASLAGAVPATVDAEARTVLAGEVRHWRGAALALGDLEMVAAPAAWAALESYLERAVRSRLRAAAAAVAAGADRLASALTAAAGGADLAAVRAGLLRLRRDYLRAETVIEFFADAVNTRTNPRIAAILRGLDALAVDSMQRVLGPLRIEVPPALTYLDRGLGASILRAGARLWDASLSPAAAIKITHHNLLQPTSLVHETGHQVAHLTGWTAELGQTLRAVVEPVSPTAADIWHGWASEVAADVYAFALLGYAPLPALATVVDGSSQAVFRLLLADPHPFGWLRVRLGAALCRDWFGAGPWDVLEAVWVARHPLAAASPLAADLARASVPLLPELARACLRAPMHAFGGVPLSEVADPARVAPAELERLAARAGPSLHTSTYLQQVELMRILAWTVLRGDTATTAAWLRDLGGRRAAA